MTVEELNKVPVSQIKSNPIRCIVEMPNSAPRHGTIVSRTKHGLYRVVLDGTSITSIHSVHRNFIQLTRTEKVAP